MLAALLVSVAVLMILLQLLFLRQQGRVLHRLDALEAEQLAWRLGNGAEGDSSPRSGSAVPTIDKMQREVRGRLNRTGLAVGTPAPPFTAFDLATGAQFVFEPTLHAPLILVFVSAGCAPCARVLKRLAALPDHLVTDRVIVVGHGSPDELSRLAGAAGFNGRLVAQRAWEVSRQYCSFAMPNAYRIDATGHTGAEIVTGSESVTDAVLDFVFGISPNHHELLSAELADTASVNGRTQ